MTPHRKEQLIEFLSFVGVMLISAILAKMVLNALVGSAP